MFSLKGLGACEEVGRSGFILDFGEKLLLDYGVKVAPDGLEYPLDVDENIKAIILSHAHLDHSGYLPYFYKRGNAVSFMTAATLGISDILWQDSLKIADIEGSTPKYTKADISDTHKHNFLLDYRKEMHITDKLSLEFFDAAHILGSALSKITYEDKIFLYTGDFKEEETQLHKGMDDVGKVDYVMLESTYGDREHPKRKEVEKSLCESVQDTVDNGGHAIIPAFAVGRTQEVVDILSSYNVTGDVYIDGMGKKVADLYIKYSNLIKNPKKLKEALANAKWIYGTKDRKEAMKKPGIIVTTSGMMKGGPVVGYVEKMLNDPKSKIHLSGYQGDETPGRMLQDEGKLPYGQNGKIVKVGCKYEKYDLSAHPGQAEMIRALKSWSPSKAFLVHGDKKVMPLFKKKIEEETGIEVVIPKQGKKVEFD